MNFERFWRQDKIQFKNAEYVLFIWPKREKKTCVWRKLPCSRISSFFDVFILKKPFNASKINIFCLFYVFKEEKFQVMQFDRFFTLKPFSASPTFKY